MNNEDLADQILEQVRGMVESALDQFRFAPGNPTTTVLAGYPYSVVSGMPPQVRQDLYELVDRTVPYWKRTGDQVQFFPHDHTVRALWGSCYSSPPPIFRLPSGKVYFFIETRKDVSALTKCFGKSSGDPGNNIPPNPGTPQSFPQSVRVLSTEIQMLSYIPIESPSDFHNPCGDPVFKFGKEENGIRANLYWPGIHTFYTPLFVKPAGDPTDEAATPFRSLDSEEYAYWSSYSEGSWNLWLLQLLEGSGNAVDANAVNSIYASSTIQIVNAPWVAPDDFNLTNSG